MNAQKKRILNRQKSDKNKNIKSNTWLCLVCNKEKPFTEEYFPKRKDSRWGLRYICKKCKTIQMKKYYINNKKELTIKNKERHINYRTKNPTITYWKQRAVHYLGSMTKWQKLAKIWEKQNYKCALSNIPIIPGINIEIDHVKPCSKFPELKWDINNLQLLHKDINRMKWNFTKKEFIYNLKILINFSKINLQERQNCYKNSNPIVFNRESIEASLRHSASNCLKNSKKINRDALWQLFLNQQGICWLFGIPIQIGVNAWLDHIKPVSKYPESKYDINNLQWVCKKANKMKNNIPMEQLIYLAKKILNNK